ncbi:UvrD-helicase domain-containing protein, partial [Methylorubrum thiocyanatum]
LRQGMVQSGNPRVGSVQTKYGVVVYGSRSSEKNYIVFDLEQSNLFKSATDYQAILYLQRVLRFSVKYWNKGIMTPAEKVVSAKTAAVFPFPLSQKTGFRITIDLNPDLERLSKRGKSGRYLLVYKAGTEQGEGPNENANIATFRKFLEDLESLNPEMPIRNPEASAAWDDNFTSTSLSLLSSKVDIHQGYDTWLRLLTDDQRSFVLTRLSHPIRIDGPAGTGKTASLSLAAIHAMRDAKEANRELQSVFFTHSEASRRSIYTVLEAMGGSEYIADQASIRRIRVETLQGFCAQLLRQDISETEFVDPDAYDAKQLQMMYVDEALRQVRPEYTSYEKFMSPEMREYMESENDESKITLIQHEIAVIIKGRSKENLDIYKKTQPIPSGLPAKTEADKAFIWRIYEKYRDQLVTGGQFDTDDVVLSALSQLSTPIWRRRRIKDGFDMIYVDETHLFNMNELSIFHHLTKSEDAFPIAFAVDRSQAIGDRGWADDIDVTSLMPSEESISSSRTVKVNGIFRCSPDIVNLAFSITSSGASLFTNFQDPMSIAHSNMTYEEEKKSNKPFYRAFSTDSEMVEAAFTLADKMRDEMSTSRGDVAIVVFEEDLFRQIEVFAADGNRPVEILKQRGDSELLRRAKTSGRFVVSLPDYVGGLEFDGVILVGVDAGRVPPTADGRHSQSKAYVTFASHNKLYVSVTRARYQVAILGLQARGPSEILNNALKSGALEQNNR